MPAAERIPVLMYHRIDPPEGRAERRYCVTPDRFAAQMSHLARSGLRAVPVEALVAWLECGPALSQGDFVLTFDDGFLGVREHALPVLAQLGWPFAAFLVTDLLGGVDTWKHNDGTAGGRHALLSANEVLATRENGASFHSHICGHLSLPTLDDATLVAEISGSRATLTGLLGEIPFHLAYPYGQFDARIESAARTAGYRAAFSVQTGFNPQDVNPFRIGRLDVFGTDTPAMLMRKVQLGSNDGSLRASVGYYWSRMTHRTGGRGS